MNHLPPSPWKKANIRVISDFSKNSCRYLQVQVHQRFKKPQWQIWKFTTSVNHIAGKFSTRVDYTGGIFATSINDTCGELVTGTTGTISNSDFKYATIFWTNISHTACRQTRCFQRIKQKRVTVQRKDPRRGVSKIFW